MAACPECGNESDPDDRFCSGCGRSLALDLQLLGGETVIEQETTVSTDGHGRLWLLGAVGAILIGGLFWGLSRSATNEDGESLGDEEAAAEPADDGSEDGQDDDDDERAATTESVRPTTTDELPEVGEEAVEGQPLLGRETGLDLWIGSNQKLRRLNLDTGDVVSFDVRGLPIHVNDEFLILSDTNSGRLNAVRLDDPGGANVALGTSQAWPGQVAPTDDPDHVWILSEAFDSPSWELVDLTDGSVVESRPMPVSIFFGYFLGSIGPAVSSSPAGGVYALEGDEYRHVADGSIVAVSDEYVLSQTCRQPDDCQLHWLDRTTWDEVDRPKPEIDAWYGGWLSPGARVLFTFGPRGSVLIDLERGTETVQADFYGPTQPAVDPDERYVVLAGPRLAVHDLDTGEVYEIDQPGFDEVATVFAPSG